MEAVAPSQALGAVWELVDAANKYLVEMEPWALAKDDFFHVLGVIIVAAIISSVVSGIIGSFGGDNWFAGWIFTAIAQIITAPFSALVSVLLYLDLRARKEALTADSLRAELAAGS